MKPKIRIVVCFEGWSPNIHHRGMARTPFDTLTGAGMWATMTAKEHESSGEKIAELLVMPAAGGEPQQISKVEDRIEGSSAARSPDGALIAYLGRDKTLRVVPAAGGPSRVLASNVGAVRGRGVAWSPDRQEIAFAAGDRIWKIARGGGEPKEIGTRLQGAPAQVDWSPDGKRLMFAFAKGGETELWLMTDFQSLEGTHIAPIR